MLLLMRHDKMFLLSNPKTQTQRWRDKMEIEFNKHKESERLKFIKQYRLNQSRSESSR